MQIGKRLKFLCDCIGRCECLGDVGTDHALLPVYAVKNGIAGRSVASDINKGPVERAKNRVRLYGLSDKIDVRLCAGLSGYKVGECDKTVIAGMGGMLISDILGDSPEVAERTEEFILSPNSCEEDLRSFLWKNGYEITDEKCISEEGHNYLVMIVKYTGEVRKDFDYSQAYLGDFILKKKDDKNVKAYLEGLARKFEIRTEGLMRAVDFNEEEFTEKKKILEIIKNSI